MGHFGEGGISAITGRGGREGKTFSGGKQRLVCMSVLKNCVVIKNTVGIYGRRGPQN